MYVFSIYVQMNSNISLQDDATRTKVFGAYRSICINYLGLAECLEASEFDVGVQSFA